MMHSRRLKKVITLALLSSQTVLASDPFSPSIRDLNTIFNDPGKVDGIYCDANYQKGTLDHTYCLYGVGSAEDQAKDYAAKAGAFLGCIDGMSQGLNKTFNLAKNPDDKMRSDAAAMYANTTFPNAENAAITAASGRAATVSVNDIINRYRSVIGVFVNGQQKQPDKSYVEPTISHTESDQGNPNVITYVAPKNGYAIDVLDRQPESDLIYTKKWVTRQSDPYHRVQARALYGVSNGSVSFDDLCEYGTTAFGRKSLPNYSIWDLFRNYSQINFEQYGWRNAEWAWDVLIDPSSRSLFTHLKYKSSVDTEKLTETVAVNKTVYERDINGDLIKIPDTNPDGSIKKDAAGNIIYKKDANGNFVFKSHEEFDHLEQRSRALTDAERQHLRDVYKQSFIDTYKMYYAPRYVSVAYHAEGAKKRAEGERLGLLMGREAALETAKMEAYNAAYKAAGEKKFDLLVLKNHSDSFKAMIKIFAENPVYEFGDSYVYGETNDGIFRRNEGLGIYGFASNLGEISRPTTISLSASSREATSNGSAYQFSIPALSKGQFRSGILGNVNRDAKLRNTIMASFTLGNPGPVNTIKSNLSMQKDQPIAIRDYLEVASANSALDVASYTTGVLKVDVRVVNPACKVNLERPTECESPLVVSNIRVDLDGSMAGLNAKVASLQIPGGGERKETIPVSGLDPMKIIDTGSVSGVVSTTLGQGVNEVIADSAAIRANLPSDALHSNPTISAIIRYYNALVTGKSDNTGSQSKSDRISALVSRIVAQNKADIAPNNIVWHKDSDGDYQRSIVASLQRMYNEANRGTERMSAEAKTLFNRLGSALALEKANVKGGRGFGSRKKNRRAYIAQLKKFAPNLADTVPDGTD